MVTPQNPLTDWRGWLGACLLVALFALPSLLGDGPEEEAEYRQAAEELRQEYLDMRGPRRVLSVQPTEDRPSS